MIRIAIAEDDFRIAHIQEQFLRQIKGVKVAGKALNAEETLKLLEKETVDLLLLDIYMPDMLGTELLPVIKSRFPNVDIVVITAASEKSILEQALQYGIFHYLLKPVPLEKFQTVIEQYRKKKKMMTDAANINQEFLDHYFTGASLSKQTDPLPTGIDQVTLDRVAAVLSSKAAGVSIEETGNEIGASRTTARRYLEYLVQTGHCRVEHEYGIVGRPERKYFQVAR